MTAGPHWSLTDDRKKLRVVFPTTPTPSALEIDAAGVDDLIRNLAEMRAAMTPEVPNDYQLGQKVGVLPDPAWRSEPDMLNAWSLLHIRHPGIGWLHFGLTLPDAAKLAGFLRAQAEAAAQPPSTPAH